MNDFVAAGYGLLTLDVDTECVTLQVREGERRNTRVAEKPRRVNVRVCGVRYVLTVGELREGYGWAGAKCAEFFFVFC